MKRIPMLTLLVTLSLLVLRMTRAGFVIAGRCWRIGVREGDTFEVKYSCVLDFTPDPDTGKIHRPRVIEQ